MLKGTDPFADRNKIGGHPNLLYYDAVPKTYARRYPLFFLMQLEEDLEFPIHESAPPQIARNFTASSWGTRYSSSGSKGPLGI